MKCECEHAYQDSVHGKHMRVFNQSENDKTKYRCTICAAIKNKDIKKKKQ